MDSLLAIRYNSTLKLLRINRICRLIDNPRFLIRKLSLAANNELKIIRISLFSWHNALFREKILISHCWCKKEIQNISLCALDALAITRPFRLFGDGCFQENQSDKENSLKKREKAYHCFSVSLCIFFFNPQSENPSNKHQAYLGPLFGYSGLLCSE